MPGYKKISMTHQQGSLGCVTYFYAPIWKIGLCLLYHQTKMFIQEKWYLSAMAKVFFEVKKGVKNSFSRDLEIQIYWLSKQNSKTKLNLWEKTAVDKSAWIKACTPLYNSTTSAIPIAFDRANHSIAVMRCRSIRWSWYIIHTTHDSSNFCIHSHPHLHSYQMEAFCNASIIMIFSSISTISPLSSTRWDSTSYVMRPILTFFKAYFQHQGTIYSTQLWWKFVSL